MAVTLGFGVITSSNFTGSSRWLGRQENNLQDSPCKNQAVTHTYQRLRNANFLSSARKCSFVVFRIRGTEKKKRILNISRINFGKEYLKTPHISLSETARYKVYIYKRNDNLLNSVAHTYLTPIRQSQRFVLTTIVTFKIVL